MKDLNKQKYFYEISSEWLNYKKLSIKYSTYEKYEIIIFKHLNQRFENINIYDINEELIINYFHVLMNENNYSVSTVKAIRYVLKAILEYAQTKYELIHINFQFIKLGKSNQKHKLLTHQQRQLLETYCFSHLNNISLVTLLSLYGGFRLGEVAGLRWEDIDFHAGLIYVNRTIERLKTNQNSQYKTELMVLEPKTLTSKRIVPIPDFILNYIKEYYQSAYSIDQTYYIYTNSNKISDPRNIQYHFQKICHEHHFHINYHSLRHTYATNCIMSDIDVKSLSEMLGHSNVSITLELYVHSTMEFKKDQVSKLKKLSFITEQEVI